jgi:hypothetical protein
MVEEQEITAFDILYPISGEMEYIVDRDGLNALLLNKAYRKNAPCLLCSLYYRYKNIYYIKPLTILISAGIIKLADFGDFQFGYNDLLNRYDFKITGDTTGKYGSRFDKILKSIITIRNDYGICSELLSAITYHEKDGNPNIDGIRVLYTVAAIRIYALKQQSSVEKMRSLIDTLINVYGVNPLDIVDYINEKYKKKD